MKGMSQEAVLARWDMQHQVDPDEDLNKLDDETLRAKKLAMDEIFEKNKLTPDDPDYVYDKESSHAHLISVLICRTQLGNL